MKHYRVYETADGGGDGEAGEFFLFETDAKFATVDQLVNFYRTEQRNPPRLASACKIVSLNIDQVVLYSFLGFKK